MVERVSEAARLEALQELSRWTYDPERQALHRRLRFDRDIMLR